MSRGFKLTEEDYSVIPGESLRMRSDSSLFIVRVVRLVAYVRDVEIITLQRIRSRRPSIWSIIPIDTS